MSKTIAFKAEHLAGLLDQQINSHIVKNAHDKELEKTDAITILVDDKVMVCGGIGEQWPGRGHLWSVFSEESKQHFVPTFRAMKTWLHEMVNTKYERIEMSMDPGFDIAHRRAKLLGFNLEILDAKKYLNGRSCSVYSLVRED